LANVKRSTTWPVGNPSSVSEILIATSFTEMFHIASLLIEYEAPRSKSTTPVSGSSNTRSLCQLFVALAFANVLPGFEKYVSNTVEPLTKGIARPD
jgi:hypothetical protein